MAFLNVYVIVCGLKMSGKKRFSHLEKFSLNFSSSAFVIPVNLLHPEPSLFFYGLLLSLWCFSVLVNYFILMFPSIFRAVTDSAPLKLLKIDTHERTSHCNKSRPAPSCKPFHGTSSRDQCVPTFMRATLTIHHCYAATS